MCTQVTREAQCRREGLHPTGGSTLIAAGKGGHHQEDIILPYRRRVRNLCFNHSHTLCDLLRRRDPGRGLLEVGDLLRITPSVILSGSRASSWRKNGIGIDYDSDLSRPKDNKTKFLLQDISKMSMCSLPTSFENPHLLAIVLDLNPYSWALLKLRKQLSFEEFIRVVLVFINSYLAAKAENRIVLIVSSLGSRLVSVCGILNATEIRC